jgi:predicted SAM-dependent methyltransferase
MSREQLVSSYISKDGLGLEVGPSFQPYFKRSAGWNVEILDHASADDLRKHYAAMGHPIDQIEEVDYISDGRLMHDIIPHRSRFDWIFAAHVIEHVTDVLGFFQSCEQLLKPDGVVLLAVPDKRYCFDVFRPLSTTGEVLEAHFCKRARHAPAKVFDHFSNIAVFNGQGGWNETDTGQFWLAEHLPNAWAYFEKAMAPGSSYIDVHGWQFTPGSFRLLLRDLHELGLLKLREKALTGGHNVEFVIALDGSSQVYTTSRLDMLEEVQREIRNGINQVLRLKDQTVGVAKSP